jgi:hypothetical protein
VYFNFGNKKKSAEAKSGEYGSWEKRVISCFTKNSQIRNDL